MLTALVCSLIGFILGAKWACSMGDKLCAMCWINQPYLKKPYVDYDQYLPQPEWAWWLKKEVGGHEDRTLNHS